MSLDYPQPLDKTCFTMPVRGSLFASSKVVALTRWWQWSNEKESLSSLLMLLASRLMTVNSSGGPSSFVHGISKKLSGTFTHTNGYPWLATSSSLEVQHLPSKSLPRPRCYSEDLRCEASDRQVVRVKCCDGGMSGTCKVNGFLHLRLRL